MRETEVLEFVIVPPYPKRHQIAASEGHFADFLKRRFRGYSFRVAGIAPVGSDDDDCFHVIPVMSFLDDGGNMRMCEPPQPWILSEISEACREFTANKRRWLS